MITGNMYQAGENAFMACESLCADKSPAWKAAEIYKAMRVLEPDIVKLNLPNAVKYWNENGYDWQELEDFIEGLVRAALQDQDNG